jgi:pyridoxal phosphate enzyme (YggS family)
LNKNQIFRDRGIHDIQWHFIGHLQRNKVKSLLPLVDTIHTVDSLELAAEIGKRWRQLQKPNRAKIFLEVNLHSESTKSGFDPQDLRNQARLLNEIQELEIRGLMCIPDPNEDSQESFVKLRILEESCRPFTHSCLSMGMSNDYAVAIQEGATHIRVGTSLFGERHPSPTQ